MNRARKAERNPDLDHGAPCTGPLVAPALERRGQVEGSTPAVRVREQYIVGVGLLGYAKLLGTLIGGG